MHSRVRKGMMCILHIDISYSHIPYIFQNDMFTHFCQLVVVPVFGSVVASTTLHLSMSSLCSMDRMVIVMSSCRMGKGSRRMSDI